MGARAGTWTSLIDGWRDSEVCLDIFYFVPFGTLLVMTTLVSAFVLRVHTMRQERLRYWKVLLAAARHKAALQNSSDPAEDAEKEQSSLPDPQPTPPPSAKRTKKPTRVD
jgi:hypothetical protein